jgi:hypothetical protein
MFLCGMAAAYKFRDRYNIRQVCVATFFICLLIPNLIIGIQVFPFVELQKYTYAMDDSVSQYEIRMVDERGQEILLDPRAVEPVRPGKATESFVSDYSDSDREKIFSHIFNESQSYRIYIQSMPLIRESTVEFPKHDIGNKWTHKELDEYGEFVAIRVYRIDKNFNKHDTEVIAESELVYEWSPDKPIAEVDE